MIMIYIIIKVSHNSPYFLTMIEVIVTSKDFKIWMRVGHRYIGYFMAGIMLIYALSGMLLVFRDTDFLKSQNAIHAQLATNLDEKQLAKELKQRNIDIQKREGDVLFFKEGQYNIATGQADYTVKKLPLVLEKMTNFHKAPSKGNLGGLNTLFGLTLLFFVLSSFFFFSPKSQIFKRGMAFLVAGALLSMGLLML